MRALDRFFRPFRNIATTTFYLCVRPQHWHAQPVPLEEFKALDRNLMVVHDGDPAATKHHKLALLLARMPILGSSSLCVVVSPVGHLGAWHIGWSTKEGVEIDRDQFRGAVRKLTRPEKMYVYGICARTGNQIALERRGGGKVSRPRHRHFPLA